MCLHRTLAFSRCWWIWLTSSGNVDAAFEMRIIIEAEGNLFDAHSFNSFGHFWCALESVSLSFAHSQRTFSLVKRARAGGRVKRGKNWLPKCIPDNVKIGDTYFMPPEQRVLFEKFTFVVVRFYRFDFLLRGLWICDAKQIEKENCKHFVNKTNFYAIKWKKRKKIKSHLYRTL